jgi:hypothetical protein
MRLARRQALAADRDTDRTESALPVIGAGTLLQGGRDWHGVLRQLAGALQEILRTDLVRSDREAQRIIFEMIYCRDLAQVDAQMDLLALRVGRLLAEKTGDASAATRMQLLTGARGQASLRMTPTRHAALSEQTATRAARTFLRL